MSRKLRKFLKPFFEIPKEDAGIANLKNHARAGNKKAIDLLKTMTAGKPARKSKDRVPLSGLPAKRQIKKPGKQGFYLSKRI